MCYCDGEGGKGRREFPGTYLSCAASIRILRVHVFVMAIGIQYISVINSSTTTVRKAVRVGRAFLVAAVVDNSVYLFVVLLLLS